MSHPEPVTKINYDNLPAYEPPRPSYNPYAPALRPEEQAAWVDVWKLGLNLDKEVTLARVQLSRTLARAQDESATACDGKRCPYLLVSHHLELVARLVELNLRAAKQDDLLVDEEGLKHLTALLEKYISSSMEISELSDALLEYGGGDRHVTHVKF